VSSAGSDITVYITFEGYNLGQGCYVEPMRVDNVPSNTTAGEVTVKVLKELGYRYEADGKSSGTGKGSDFYLAAVKGFDTGSINVPDYIASHGGPSTLEARQTGNDDDYLGEFDYSYMSGWCITVSQDFINRSAGAYGLRDGDVIRWQFTLWGYGADLGHSASWSDSAHYEHADKGDLIRALADNPRSELYDLGLEALNTPLAAQNSVDAITDAIESGDAEFDGDIEETDPYPGSETLADFTELEKVVDRAKSLKETNYTAASWEAFSKKLSSVEDLMQYNRYATATTVDIAIIQLEAAIDKLVFSSSGGGGGGGGGGGSDETASPSPEPTPTADVTADSAPMPISVEEVYGDVSASSWYAPDVAFVTEKGLMKGKGDESTFAPNDPTTRAEWIMVLARMSGASAANEDSSPWYKATLDWASAEGLTDGLNPNSATTREQLVTILWRLNDSPESGADLGADGENVSDWASGAVTWAVEQGILQGDANGLRPKDDVKRSEVAAILRRYIG
jgi:hypothetical protein